MLERLKRFFADPRAPRVAALLGVLLTLPALGTGYFADDFTHRISFLPEYRGPGGIRGDWDLFNFTGPDRAHFHRLLDAGVWPWWSAPSLRLAFFRPLSALSHALDYRLLARFPVLLHAESVALYAAIVLVAAALYRRLLGTGVALGLAAVLFAVDDAHSLPVTWLANRNALFAALFGFAALAAHDRARRDGDRRAGIAAPILYAGGLLGGEPALATLAYLVAHALFIDEARPRRRLAALAPYGVVTLAWAIVYAALGYGTQGGGYYVDPGHEPLAFAKAAVVRFPVLLLAQMLAPPSDGWLGVAPARLPWLLGAACVVLAALALGIARVIGRDRRARFFATGMVLSLLPVCATFPNDRLLLFAGLGGSGLVALFLARVGDVARGRATSMLAALLVFVHAIAAPVLLPIRCRAFAKLYSGYVARADASLPRFEPDDTLVVVNAPDLLVVNYAECARTLRGETHARRHRLLATAIDGNAGELQGVDAHTVELALRGGFVADPFSQVARGPQVRFAAGDVTRVDGMSAAVVEITPDGRPKRVRFRFDHALDDPSLRWVRWDGLGFVPVTPPAIGESLPVPTIDVMAAVFGST